MKWVPVRGLGSKGVVSDEEAYNLPLTVAPEAHNVRMERGKMVKTLGYVTNITLPEPMQRLAGWLYSGENSWLLAAETKLYKYDGVSVSDISQGGGTYGTGFWSINQIGAACLFTKTGTHPQAILPGDVAVSDMAGWTFTTATTVTVKEIKTYSSFLVALGVQEDGTDFPYRVRWSDEYAPTGLPTTWDETDVTALAGFNDLDGAGGALVGQLPMGDFNMLYRTRSVWRMTYTAGALIFEFKEVFGDVGALNGRSFCEFNNMHFVVGTNDIYVHNGATKKSLAARRIRKRFFAEIADKDSVFVLRNDATREVMVFYSTVAGQEADRVMAYSWEHDAFTFRDIQTGTVDYALVPDAAATTNWTEVNDPWSQLTASWVDISLPGTNLIPIFITNLDTTAFRDGVGLKANGAPITAFYRHTGLDLESLGENATSHMKHIDSLLPQIKGVGSVTVRLGSAETAHSGVYWGPGTPFNLGTDLKVDCFIHGRYLALEVFSEGEDDYWELTGFDMHVGESYAI